MTSQLTTHSHLNPSRFPRSNHILLIIAAALLMVMPCRIISRFHFYFRCCCCRSPKLSLTILTCTPKLEGCRRQALKREQLKIHDPEAQLCAALYHILRPWRNCVVSVGSVLRHGSGHPVAFHQGLAQNDLSPRRFLSSFFIPQVHHPTHKTSKMVRIQTFSRGITKEN